MITKYKNKGLTWVDVLAPTKEEAIELMTEYDLNPLVMEEILSPSQRVKVDRYDTSIFMVLHFPKFHLGKGQSKEQEIDFITGKKFLITVHYEIIDPLHQFSKAFEVNSILGKKDFGNHAGFLFFYLIRELYHNTADQMVEVGSSLKDVEKNIFDGHENEIVQVLSHISRQLIEMRQITHLHEHVLNSFDRAARKFFGEDFAYHLSAIIGEFNKTQNILDNYRGILEDLKDTNDALLSVKTSQIMKKLTALNFIMLPLAIIVNFFIITRDSFLIESKTGVFLVIIGVSILAIFLYVYSKKRNWL